MPSSVGSESLTGTIMVTRHPRSTASGTAIKRTESAMRSHAGPGSRPRSVAGYGLPPCEEPPVCAWAAGRLGATVARDRLFCGVGRPARVRLAVAWMRPVRRAVPARAFPCGAFAAGLGEVAGVLEKPAGLRAERPTLART